MDTDSEEGDLRIEENGKVDSSVELFGVQLEVTSKLLEAELRKLRVLQQELGHKLSAPKLQKEKVIDQLKQNISRIQQQYDQLNNEYQQAAIGCLQRCNKRRKIRPLTAMFSLPWRRKSVSLSTLTETVSKSSRSQPAIGLKQTPKSRPTIFGTLAKDRSPAQDSRRQSIGPQMMSLCHMFRTSGDGYNGLPHVDENEALIFQDGNLLAGSLDALIQHLVPTTEYYPDRTYIFAFLLSSRLFAKPHNLLKEVCRLCIYQQNLSDEHKVNKEALGKFGPHIVQLLGEWTEMIPYDFRDERMMKQLKDLTQKIVTIYPELRKEVGILMHNLISKLSSLQKYEEVLTRITTEVSHRLTSIMPPTTDIYQVCPSALDLAQQLTHIELERLTNIGPEEFVQAFAKENELETRFDDMKKTNNLEAYVQWFNRLSYLVATEICMHLKKKNRVRMIEYFIDVAKECFNIGNFNSLMAIIAGMNMSPVARLKKTWAKVNTQKFEILEHQMDPSNNFNSYRSTLKAALWRCEGAVEEREKIVIPFFSLLVKDIYFLNEGCANRLPNGHINFEKFWQLAKQITEFITWKQVECPFERQSSVLNYVLTNPVFSENSLALASFECEPPENQYEKDRHKQLKDDMAL